MTNSQVLVSPKVKYCKGLCSTTWTMISIDYAKIPFIEILNKVIISCVLSSEHPFTTTTQLPYSLENWNSSFVPGWTWSLIRSLAARFESTGAASVQTGLALRSSWNDSNLSSSSGNTCSVASLCTVLSTRVLKPLIYLRMQVKNRSRSWHYLSSLMSFRLSGSSTSSPR